MSAAEIREKMPELREPTMLEMFAALRGASGLPSLDEGWYAINARVDAMVAVAFVRSHPGAFPHATPR